jgi:hypothetical protein
MRNIFELSEEEKNKIRGLHESYKSKPGTSLNEQKARPTGLKVEPGSFDISRTKTKETGALTGQEGKGEEDYFTPEDNKEALTRYNDPKQGWKPRITSYIWDKIKWWDVSSKNAFNKIMKDSPYIMFNVVAEIDRKDGDSAAVKSQRVVIQDLGEKTITEPGTPGTPGKIDYLTFPYPTTPGLTSDFFPNNSWTPTKEFANYVQTQIVDPIKLVYDEAMAETKQKPTMFLQYMNVESSVSKF